MDRSKLDRLDKGYQTMDGVGKRLIQGPGRGLSDAFAPAGSNSGGHSRQAVKPTNPKLGS